MIALEVFVPGKFMTFRELLVYFEFRLSSLSVIFFLFAVLLRFAKANYVEFKFVARQIEASVVIRAAAKLKFVAESRTRVYFAQHVSSTIFPVIDGSPSPSHPKKNFLPKMPLKEKKSLKIE